MRQIVAVSLMPISFLLLVHQEAKAQETEGAFRMGLETSLFHLDSNTLESDETDIKVSQTTTLFGIGPTTLGANLGYGAADTVIVGTRLLLDFESTGTETENAGSNTEDADVTGTKVVLAPYLECAFAPGASVRGFLSGSVGLVVNSASNEELDVSQTSFMMNAILGVHAFLSEGFSIDPSVGIGFQTGSQTEEMEGFEDIELSLFGFSFFGMIGFTGWVGAESPVPEEETQRLSDAYRSPSTSRQGTMESSGSMHSAPASRTIQPISRQSGEIMTKLNLNAFGVDLLGNPIQNQDRITVTVTKTGLRPELADCSQIVLSTGEHRFEITPLRHQAQAYGRGVMEILRGSIDTNTLLHLEQASTISVEVCGSSSSITRINMGKLKGFVKRFRDKAPQGSVPIEPSAPSKAIDESTEKDPETEAGSQSVSSESNASESSSPKSANQKSE